MIEKIDFVYTDEITVVNQEQFDVHVKLYDGYVNAINKIDEILYHGDAQREESNSTFSYYRELKRGETFALDGVILHELYFSNIGGTVNEPEEFIRSLLAKDFGSFEKWQEDFIATAKASRGWAILCYDQRGRIFRDISLDAHDVGNIAYSAPILILDMYEHAYFLQYTDNKVEYINNFMKNINWAVIGDRLSWSSSLES